MVKPVVARSAAHEVEESEDVVIARMTSITQSATQIANIISVIDGIAFQSAILALNASIEAARADM